jgi:hypothetical protein
MERQIEAQPPLKLLNPVRRHLGIGAQHDRHRIAGDKADHQEHQHRHPEEHQHQVEQPGQQEARGHGRSRAPPLREGAARGLSPA